MESVKKYNLVFFVAQNSCQELVVMAGQAKNETKNEGDLVVINSGFAYYVRPLSEVFSKHSEADSFSITAIKKSMYVPQLETVDDYLPF